MNLRSLRTPCLVRSPINGDLLNRRTSQIDVSVALFTRSDATFIMGILAVVCMLGSYALMRSTYSSIAFAIAWTFGTIFLLLKGVWPVAAIQAVFAALAFRRHWRARRLLTFQEIGNVNEKRAPPPGLDGINCPAVGGHNGARNRQPPLLSSRPR
jgi:hypothetical protein